VLMLIFLLESTITSTEVARAYNKG
jgi:hypothetical protein